MADFSALHLFASACSAELPPQDSSDAAKTTLYSMVSSESLAAVHRVCAFTLHSVLLLCCLPTFRLAQILPKTNGLDALLISAVEESGTMLFILDSSQFLFVSCFCRCS